MTLRRGPGLRVLAVLSLSLASLVVVASCAFDVGDQVCTVSFNPNDHDRACPYGPPGGPKVSAAGCEPIDLSQMNAPSCVTSSFRNDVYPILSKSPPGLPNGCANDACHGGTRPPVFKSDAESMYNALALFQGSHESAYIDKTHPEQSWILCNLKGTTGGGDQMPTGQKLGKKELDVIEAWAKCGLRLDAMGDGGPGDGGGDAADGM